MAVRKVLRYSIAGVVAGATFFALSEATRAILEAYSADKPKKSGRRSPSPRQQREPDPVFVREGRDKDIRSPRNHATSLDLLAQRTPVYKIVITGGPCGGKTTFLSRASEFLRARGFRVFTCPEAATTLWSSGVARDDLSSDKKILEFQSTILRTQLSSEDSFETLSQIFQEGLLDPHPVVILCDRGALDGSAYISEEGWKAVMKRTGVTLNDLCKRYHAVIHFVSAADGAAEFYNLTSNTTRNETIEEAVALDRKTKDAWKPHKNHLLIENPTTNKEKLSSFETKLQNAINALCDLLNIPKTRHEQRRFVLHSLPTEFPVAVRQFHVEKIYLTISEKTHDSYAFIRQKVDALTGNRNYGWTRSIKTPDGLTSELKRIISAREYMELSDFHADRTRNIVNQERYYFSCDGRHYEIYQYTDDFAKGTMVLNCSLTEDSETIVIPEWIKPFVGEEVTNDAHYSSSYISKMKK